MKRVALIMAMETEAAELIAALGLHRVDLEAIYRHLPLRFFRGSFRAALDITLTLPGQDTRYGCDAIGTEAAAVAAFSAIREFKPDLLINAGTAGSFQKAGASIGKVYLSRDRFFFHDHRIPLDAWREFANGGYPSADVSELASELGLAMGAVSSGSSLDFTADDLTAIERNGAVLKEMEAAAIAYVAHITKLPFFAVKSVTNLIDVNPDSPAEFEKNFSVATKTLSQAMLAVFESLAQKPEKIEDWRISI